MKPVRFALLAWLLTACIPSSLFALPIGIDTFSDGTTQGWFVPGAGGHPAPPQNVGTGGPGGAGDAYLQLTSFGGDGPGSRLSVLNTSQWTGDYLSAGLTAISMDVNNFGNTDLYLHLLIVNFPDNPGPPTDVAWTLVPVIVAAGSGWQTVQFSFSSLFAPFGTIAGALSSVDELRLFHSVAPVFGGPGMGAEPIAAVLGVDNIQAVPEPATLLLLGAGVAALARSRRTGGARRHN
jgi:PEP-CTERM motif